MKNIIEQIQFLHNSDNILDYRNKFSDLKKNITKKEVIYFCGNSLGLKPKSTNQYIIDELNDWQDLGVEGHFKKSKPWVSFHEKASLMLAHLIMAEPSEITVMNSLSVNLHLLMVSFYRPTPKKYKILIEKGAFPSDQYIVDSQAKFHGYNPQNAIIEIENSLKNGVFTTEDIINSILKNKDEIAIILLGAVNYYTGQVLDLKKISSVAKDNNITIGFDLAHAIGNIHLKMSEYDIDFATWCSYKYLNAGPGGVSGVYINKKHFLDSQIPRFEGWWGCKADQRFEMKKTFEPAFGADAWQLSNVPVFSIASLEASLDIFNAVGMPLLIKKSILMHKILRQGLEWCKANYENSNFEIITPKEDGSFGCQISILVTKNGRKLYDYLHSNSIIVDWRNPNVIRLAPVPLYNTFDEIGRFLKVFKKYFELK